MHVLVVTTVHVPTDARILHRQVRSLLHAGHEVTYAAPWRDRKVLPPDGLTAVDLPAAAGRRRAASLVAARRLLASPPPSVDVALLHDPELLPAAVSAPRGLPVCWDVHEDVRASLDDKEWLPKPVRPLMRAALGALEHWAENRCRILLAEVAYAARFRREHLVVPNLPWLRPLALQEPEARAVHVGRLSEPRGAVELVSVGRLLRRRGIALDLVGPADTALRPLLHRANAAGDVRWHGYLPNPDALRLVEGALVGLALLHDTPNYRQSMPTKLLEYMERGLPILTTPLPLASALATDHGCGDVVPFSDAGACARAVEALHEDPLRRAELSAAARHAAVEHYTWDRVAPAFVAQLERWAA